MTHGLKRSEIEQAESWIQNQYNNCKSLGVETVPVFDTILHALKNSKPSKDYTLTKHTENVAVFGRLFPDEFNNGGWLQDLCYTCWDRGRSNNPLFDWSTTRNLVLENLKKIKSIYFNTKDDKPLSINVVENPQMPEDAIFVLTKEQEEKILSDLVQDPQYWRRYRDPNYIEEILQKYKEPHDKTEG